ncbi:aspartate/glutamate racemase family protein [Gordonia sp. NB41Y]|uniref:aspartate/glutamate racemase family protein n=1 Tax=Gordonia sp. NB41Y TaxID=875808 RepID=UPI0002C02BEE|nr:aspartate/glutamate racemase family protein [Gordonia sp. NB41Y]EMP14358.1 Asp/Glu/hydantoin racemase [Gordonia sp. NB41Y]WLP92167.1 aspartate/glutamate racemase family protein [Gordonia sp. NB41Y]
MSRRIVVMNCNTSEPMTAAIGAQAQRSARPDTEIIALHPLWGPESAEGYYDSFVTAAAVLDRMHTLPARVDAVVMAGFGEHGREGARELLDIPVVDVTEAGATFAQFLAPTYGVVTTLPRACAQIRDSLRTAGLLERCTTIEAADIPVLALEAEHDTTVKALCQAGIRAIDRGAEALVLGCAGMAGLDATVSEELGVPVVDGVAAAVAQAEALVHLGLTTSKTLSYAHPRSKLRTGWPISTEEYLP